ncbi:MAG: CoA transferase, partial [Dehalococcoidia bacterium]|nr:CoA transferase [Dehalococcoidia bacterium]
VAGLFGAMASVMALYHRDTGAAGQGQVVDVSLFEPLFRLAIPYVTLYDLLNVVRHRVGNEFPDAAPRTMLKTKDDRWVGLSATTQGTWEDLAMAIGRPELIGDPRFLDNASRVSNRAEINAILQGWMSDKSLEQVMDLLVPAGGVVGPVYDIAQIVADPHYRARDDIIEIQDPDLGDTKMVGVVPKFSSTPGEVTHGGPALGEHNDEVYGGLLGLSVEEIERMRETGII